MERGEKKTNTTSIYMYIYCICVYIFFKMSLHGSCEYCLCSLCNIKQIDSFAGENNSSSLVFNKMPEVQREQLQWTDDEIRDAIDIVYQNLQRLDSYLSVLVRLSMLLYEEHHFPRAQLTHLIQALNFVVMLKTELMVFHLILLFSLVLLCCIYEFLLIIIVIW